MPEAKFFVAQTEDAGKRMDVFLAERMPETSRSAIRNWILAGLAKLAGEVQKPGRKMRAGDRVSVSPPPPEPGRLAPEDIPVRVVFEDESLVVVDKPAGMVVHPGAGNRSGTLANALAHHFSRLGGPDRLRPGLVHRLDKNTSGLLVVAKSDLAHERLAGQFKARRVEKEYLALVHGRLARRSGAIDAPVGRHPTARVKMSTSSRKPRPALTEYEVIRYFAGFSYVRVKLHTGRTHQIRVHFQHIGHPVAGDATYGAGARAASPQIDKALKRLGRHFLHAARLAFQHPAGDATMRFESPLPPELAAFLRLLEAGR